jgi:quercetin dioxygenase-like cupin family protein
MATTGQTLSNPVTGETITFRRTAADTSGEYVEIDLLLEAGGQVPGLHVHPLQEEKFEVLGGTMKFRYGRRKIVAEAGETVTVPAGVIHNFANASKDEDARVRVTITPALDMEQLFETTVRLAEEGRVNRKGMPKPVELAMFVERFRHEVEAPFPPPSVVRFLMAPLRRIGERRERRATAGKRRASVPSYA